MVGWKASLFLLFALILPAQDLRKLPDWAQAAAAEVAGKPTPEADAWIVLDRTEMAYTGEGEVRTRKLRLVKITTERGLNEAAFLLRGLGGKASKIKKLKGWNLRPDGELVKLNDDLIVTTGTSSSDRVSSAEVTIAVLPRAVKGSWIAFESMEVFNHPMGPTDLIFPMESRPIHRWELTVAKQEGWFSNLKHVKVLLDARNFKPWFQAAEVVPGQSVRITDLPALPEDEGAHPQARDVVPAVLIRFDDPTLQQMPSIQSWDLMARFFHDRYQSRYSPKTEMGIQGKDPAKALHAIRAWMTRELTYRQVYLSPERTCIPEFVPETLRKRYGDCKDLASCFISEARNAGLKAYPVLARINEGHASSAEPVSLETFNHVIVGVKLEQSLGLASEVETAQGRILLVDPTDRLAPLGALPVDHRGREVLLCSENGGLWIKIPVSAVKVPRTRVTIKGEVMPPGRLEATVTFEEEADGFGLRQACLDRGTQKMREYLLETLVDIPPTGSLEIVSVGDPFAVDQAFGVTFKIVHPDGFHLQVGEGVLASLGLPAAPSPIQKPGQARRYPVEWRGVGLREYEASIRLPWLVTPVLPVYSIHTPFRTAEWSAKALPAGGQCTLQLVYRQQRQDVFFAFDEREKGLTEWKKDRSQIKTLLNDGLAFKLNL